jgi:hypothetical protein
MKIVKKALLSVVLVSMMVWIGFVVHDYLEHRAAMAQWAPEKASVDAANDIAAGSIKIYMHGSFAAYAVGVDERFMPLIKGLPREDAGVGCVIDDLDVFEAQRQYATRYNKLIVEHLQARSERNG